MLKFNGRIISGSHSHAIVGSPEQHVRRVKYWDLVGEAEVVGQRGGRQIFYDILLHDGYTQTSLIDELEILDDTVGENGTLRETGNVTRKFKDCTFDGYELIPFGGAEPGMLQDVAKTLRDDNGAVETTNGGEGGWFVHVRLMFRQLKA